MLEIKYLGISDEHYEHGKIYKLIKFENSPLGFLCYIVDKENKIHYDTYIGIGGFNIEWEVVE